MIIYDRLIWIIFDHFDTCFENIFNRLMLRIFFRRLDIPFKPEARVLNFLFMSVSRLVCEKRYWGNIKRFTRCLEIANNVVLYWEICRYIDAIIFVIFFDLFYFNYLCWSIFLILKCHFVKTQEHACLFFLVQHDNRILM